MVAFAMPSTFEQWTFWLSVDRSGFFAPHFSDSSSMQQFLQSVNCSRIGSDQVAAYVLQPSAGSGPSTSAQVTPTPPPNSRATTSGSEQSERDRPDPATREGASQSGDNSAQTSTDTADRAGPGSSREGSSADWRNPANGDYRGVFAIFRARDSGSWNLDESDIDSEPSDVQPVAGSLLFDRRVASSEPRDLGSDPDASDVSLSVNSERSSLFAGEPTGEDSVSFRSPAYWAAESSNPDPSTASTRSGVDGAWGVGRVINVGGSPRPAHQGTHASSSHSSSFSNIGNQEAGGGTAVATATARTFRHVHTAVVVTDGTNGGPQLALSTAINRAIAGAFAGSGEGAVASNIINTTHRLQWWRCEEMQPPDLKDGMCGCVLSRCKFRYGVSLSSQTEADAKGQFCIMEISLLCIKSRVEERAAESEVQGDQSRIVCRHPATFRPPRFARSYFPICSGIPAMLTRAPITGPVFSRRNYACSKSAVPVFYAQVRRTSS